MKDYLEIGPVPCNENCAQLGEDNFRNRANIEMDTYIEQLYRQFGEKILNTSVSFRKKWFAHDFGNYGEVVISYDDEDENHHIIYEIERELPENWDDEAKAEIEKRMTELVNS